MPSLAITLWLVFIASAQADPLNPPPHGREAATPTSSNIAPAAKSIPTVAKPSEPKAPTPPFAPTPVKTPSTTVPVAKTTNKPSRLDAPASTIEEPEEEIISDKYTKAKARSKKGSRKSTPVDHPDVLERKSTWSADRYAAVVPPGLTLAALRSQLAKNPVSTTETAPAPAERSQSSQTLADIEKAREALRQETARLEALLKATGNSSGGIGMPMGDPMLPSPSLPAATLRDAPNEQIDSVSKAVKGMKPEQAAAMIARLDRGLAAEILRRMKATDAGAILGLLKPELAAELATIIATRKPAPTKDKKGSPK